MLQNTYTTDELIDRIGLMRKYYNTSLFGDKKDATLEDVIQNECDEHTFNILKSWVAAFNKQKVQPLVVYEALDTVQEDLAGMPSVTLYVPVRLNPEQIEKLGKWFRNNVQPNILISLHVDPRATGGCSFIWKDVYHDYSLRYYIDKQQDKITDMFNKYTHVK